jgi:hypothetical protein
MQNPKRLNLLINIGGALVAALVVGYVLYASFVTEVEQACSGRYPAATRFSLQTSAGKPLTAIELQARVGLRDLGVVDNARVAAVEGGPSSEALEVKLRKLAGSADRDASARSGIEFFWSPPGMAGAGAACLTYSIWLPEKFDFGGGGALPGVFGGEVTARGQRTVDNRLSVRPAWNADGKPSIGASVEGGERHPGVDAKYSLPLGRWTKVEQEVVLNTPGAADGIGRLWIDGSLFSTNTHLPLRKDAKAMLSGVLIAAGYRGLPAEPGTILLSPIEIAWR